MLVGTVAVGLFMGALYFLWYLVRLSRLPSAEREYKQNRHHLEPETLLRYVILIACLILLNVLFYTYFEFGRESVHVGVVMWVLYAVGAKLVKPLLKSRAKKVN